MYFSYDGKRSDHMDLYLVRVEEGLKSDPFLARRQMITEQIPNNPVPYIFGEMKEPIRLSLVFAPLDGSQWNINKRREIARWLDNGKYSEFFTSDDINKKYFLKCIGGDLTTNGRQDGYITVDFENVSCYTYSPVYQRKYDFSTITEPTMFTFENKGDNVLYPKLHILKISDGDLSIKNKTDRGREFKFIGLEDNEILEVDNYHRTITTSIENIYRFDNFNQNYLYFTRGVNHLEIEGKCQIIFKFRFETMG